MLLEWDCAIGALRLVRGRGCAARAIVGVLYDFGLDDAISDSAEIPSRGARSWRPRISLPRLRFDPLQLLLPSPCLPRWLLMLRCSR